MLVLSIFLSLGAFAQKNEIQGIVTDANGEALELVNAILSLESDSSFVGFAITNPKGKFLIADIDTGKYILNLSFLGYADINETIHFRESEEKRDLGSVILQESQSVLEEVDIAARRVPIRIKQDTIEYNADAFKTQANDNVEELLKKLPGIEVDSDGGIQAQGEDVQKVLVDGKEFFGNDPTVATKNLPADAVKNVQVFDKKSKKAEFSGIDDGERTKTINLSLKDDKKNGVFGNMSGSGGLRSTESDPDNFDFSDRMYAAKANLNRFDSKSQLSLIGMLNNTNEKGFSFNEYIDFMGGFSRLMDDNGRISMNDSSVPISNRPGSGFIETAAIGLNYNYELGKNSDLNFNYFFSDITSSNYSTLLKEYLTASRGFDEARVTTNRDQSVNHKASIVYDQELDSMQNISLEFSAAWNDGESNTISSTDNTDDAKNLVSGSEVNNSSVGDQLSINAAFDYRRKFKKKGRFLTLDVDYSSRNNGQDASLLSNNFVAPDLGELVDTVIRQNQLQDSDQKNYSLGFSYTEPIGKRRYLELVASSRNYDNDVLKEFYDLFPDLEPSRVLNQELSNLFRQDYNYNMAGLNIKWNFKKASLTMGAAAQRSTLKGELDAGQIFAARNFDFILPSAYYRLQISQSRGFSVNYRTSVNEPNITQLSPILDNSNPLRVYQGNPDLQPEYTHALTARYNSFSQLSNISFFTSLSLRYTTDNITNDVDIDRFGVQSTTPVNLGDGLRLNQYASLSLPLKWIKKDFRINNRFSWNDNPSLINGIENRTDRYSNTARVSLRNWNQDIVSIEVGGRLTWNQTQYSSNPERNQSFTTGGYFGELSVDFAQRWTFETDFDTNIYSAESFGDQASVTIWNAELFTLIGPNKKIKLGVSSYDLLNQNISIQRNANAIFLQEERIASLGRYVMLDLAYSFSGFGNEKGRSRTRFR